MSRILNLFFCLSLLPLADAGEVFHFDFRDANGKSVIGDKTGSVKCQVRQVPFKVESGALRIAPLARIEIPVPKIPDLNGGYTVSAWILKNSTPDVTPILSCGRHHAPVWTFGLAWRYPFLGWKNANVPDAWHGIRHLGEFGTRVHYPDPSWLLPDARLAESSGVWHQVAGVVSPDSTELYLDGEPVARSRRKNSPLPKLESPFFIGAERIDGEEDNFITSNILLNDLRLYDHPMTADKIKAVYLADRPRYPAGCHIPPGRTHLRALDDCSAYANPDFDSKFLRKLTLTAAYERRLPHDSLNGKKTTSSIKRSSGAPLLLINGVSSYPVQFAPVYLYPDGTARYAEAAAALRDFAAAGIEKAGISISNDPRSGEFWLGEGKYDWESVDRRIRDAIAANPDVLILFHIFVAPPRWFLERYPDDIEQLDVNGKLVPFVMAGFLGSENWRNAFNGMLADLVRHIESQPFAGHVYAYLPGGGNSGEWYWPGTFSPGLPGYSKATRQAFRDWLKKRYSNNLQTLRGAWGNPGIDFERADIPSPAERNASGPALLLDPARSAGIIDFRRFLCDSTYGQLSSATAAVKKALGGSKVVGVYSGYPLDMTSPKQFRSGLQIAGRVFRNPDIDFLATPIDYRKRRGGSAGLCVDPFNGSSLLHGKLLEHENDFRTHLHDKLESGRFGSLRETLSAIDRSFGNSLVRGAGLWWYLFNNAWFHQNEVMERVSRIAAAARSAVSTTRGSAAETAVIFDEASSLYIAPVRTQFMIEHTSDFYNESVRAGIPLDFYLMDDLAENDMPKYKLYIFLNAYKVTESQRDKILRKLRRENAVAVWCYAPGLIGENGFDPSSMEKLTGIRFKLLDGPIKMQLKFTDRGSAFARHAARTQPTYSISPVPCPDDPDAEVLGTAGNMPALVGKGRQFFSLMPMTQGLLRGFAELAGVHIWLDTPDVFGANSDFAMIHSSSDVPKTMTLPWKCDIYSVPDGKKLCSGTDRFTRRIPKGDTEIYQLTRSR